MNGVLEADKSSKFRFIIMNKKLPMSEHQRTVIPWDTDLVDLYLTWLIPTDLHLFSFLNFADKQIVFLVNPVSFCVFEYNMRLRRPIELPQRMLPPLMQIHLIKIGMANFTVNLLPVVVIAMWWFLPQCFPHHPFPQTAQMGELQWPRTSTRRN